MILVKVFVTFGPGGLGQHTSAASDKWIGFWNQHLSWKAIWAESSLKIAKKSKPQTMLQHCNKQMFLWLHWAQIWELLPWSTWHKPESSEKGKISFSLSLSSWAYTRRLTHLNTCLSPRFSGFLFYFDRLVCLHLYLVFCLLMFMCFSLPRCQWHCKLTVLRKMAEVSTSCRLQMNHRCLQVGGTWEKLAWQDRVETGFLDVLWIVSGPDGEGLNISGKRDWPKAQDRKE